MPSESINSIGHFRLKYGRSNVVNVPLAVSFDAALGLDSQSDVTESQKEGVFLAGSCVDVELDLVSQKELEPEADSQASQEDALLSFLP